MTKADLIKETTKLCTAYDATLDLEAKLAKDRTATAAALRVLAKALVTKADRLEGIV